MSTDLHEYGDRCEHDEIREDCVHCRVEAAIDTIDSGEGVSDPGTTMGSVTDETELDALIEKGSTPNLAALFRKGKAKGLLKPGHEYAGAT